MGVLNLTPDSFSDGGRFVDPAIAIEHGMRMAHDGADLVDVGGESTRPGAQRVDEATELQRVLPVVRELSAAGVNVSVDTMRAGVAQAAVGAGAVLVNDVSGGQADAQMLPTVAALEVPIVLMHWRSHSTTMMQNTGYAGGVVQGVCRELADRLDAAGRAGVDERRIVLDPGVGFAKQPADNWPLLRGLDALLALGRPLLVGASRKRFLGDLAQASGRTLEPQQRDGLSAAVATLCAASGVWAVRTHDVSSAFDGVLVAAAWQSTAADAVGTGR